MTNSCYLLKIGWNLPVKGKILNCDLKQNLNKLKTHWFGPCNICEGDICRITSLQEDGSEVD